MATTFKMNCLFRCCCDSEESSSDEEERHHDTRRASRRHHRRHRRSRNAAVAPARMSRQDTVPSADGSPYEPAMSEDTDEINNAGSNQSDGNNIHDGSNSESLNRNQSNVASEDFDDETSEEEICCSGVHESNQHARGIHDFFQRLREGWQGYDSVETIEDMHQSVSSKLRESGDFGSPLRTALSFDSRRGLPTINNEGVVLPGSALQKAMAFAISNDLKSQEDECVICMETFDETNPRMPTMCGCGENKTYFHLPCLYQWIEQSRNCPSCRKKLHWQEF